MEEGKAGKTRGKQPSSPFRSPTVLAQCISSLYTDWPHLWGTYSYPHLTDEETEVRKWSEKSWHLADGHSHLYNPHSPQTVLCQKVTFRSMDMHKDNSFHVSSIKKNDYFLVCGHMPYSIWNLRSPPGVCTPLQWKCGIPTPGLPGNSRNDYFLILLLS